MKVCLVLAAGAAAIDAVGPLANLAAVDVGFDSFPWGSITSSGILIWYLWYSVRVSQPRQDERLDKLHASTTAAMDKQAAAVESLSRAISGLACQHREKSEHKA